MDPTEVTILGLGITSIITIAGWFFTYRKQTEILELQRKFSTADRELAVFRERAKTVSDVCTRLMSVAGAADTVGHMIKFGMRFGKETHEAFNILNSHMDELVKLFSSHDFRVFRAAVGDEKIGTAINAFATSVLVRLPKPEDTEAPEPESFYEASKECHILSILIGSELVAYEKRLAEA